MRVYMWLWAMSVCECFSIEYIRHTQISIALFLLIHGLSIWLLCFRIVRLLYQLQTVHIFLGLFFFPRFHSVNISSEHFFSICLFFTSHILRMLLSGLRLIDLDQNWSNNWLATSIPINLFCVSGCGHTLHGRLTQGPIRVPISIYFGGYICYLSVNLQAIFNLFCTRSWNKTKSAYQFETFRCLSNVSTILQ